VGEEKTLWFISKPAKVRELEKKISDNKLSARKTKNSEKKGWGCMKQKEGKNGKGVVNTRPGCVKRDGDA